MTTPPQNEQERPHTLAAVVFVVVFVLALLVALALDFIPWGAGELSKL